MSYSIHTQVGTFWIRPHAESHGRWVLEFEHGPLGFFDSPDKAALAVGSHRTGWYNWDRLRGKIEAPKSLMHWEREGRESAAELNSFGASSPTTF